MNKVFCGVMAVTGCVLLAGASGAETSQVRGHEKSDGAHVPAHVQALLESAKQNKWSMERHANPHVGKEETKDLLRAKRPK